MTQLRDESGTLNQSKDDDVVLSVQGVSKKFCRNLKKSLLYGVQDIFGELAGVRRESNELRPQEFWALKDISFELRRGEALGLVGANGAGKTTLLRIISGLIKPDTGTVDIKGRIAPLIALGAGFNPILTGRENIYANMSILGLTKQEIDERFDEVVEFAEIGDAIDAPVQSYSSGMAARLGFACAIHTEPDILLIDEVLAVGDINFRSKCYSILSELRNKGISFLIVSHQTQMLLYTCEKAVYLSKGQLILGNDTEQVLKQYINDTKINQIDSYKKTRIQRRFQNEKVENSININSLFFRNEEGEKVDAPQTGKSCYFCVECESSLNDYKKIGLGISITGQGNINEVIQVLNTKNDQVSFEVKKGKFELRIYFPCLGLVPGIYSIKTNILGEYTYQYDAVDLFLFEVQGDIVSNECQYYQSRQWEIHELSK